MDYFILFENKNRLSELGYNVTHRLGSGQEGDIYQSNNQAIKYYHDINRIDNKKILNFLQKAKEDKYSYLVDISDYIFVSDTNELILIMELLEENDMKEYHGYSDYDLDFFQEFYHLYQKNDMLLEKTITHLINEYSDSSRENKDGVFYLSMFDDSVTEDLIQYYKDLSKGIQEVHTNGYNIDPTDDNVMYDPKQKKYKIIDYL